MKKRTVCALRLYVAALASLLMLLTGCDAAPRGSLPAAPTPTLSPTSAKEEWETPLPAQYSMKNGWLLLDLGLTVKDGTQGTGGWAQIPDPFAAMTPEELREKLLNVRFTDGELEIFSQAEHKNGCVQMIDPRLLAPLFVPSGLILKETRYCSFWSTTASVGFYYESDGSYTAGTSFEASISFKDGVGGTGQKKLDAFMEIDGEKVTLENGTTALLFEETVRELTKQTLRYVKEQEGRIYYVEQVLYFDETGASADAEAMDKARVQNTLTVTTVHKGHQFSYTVTDPAEGLAERILEMDPFTYL